MRTFRSQGAKPDARHHRSPHPRLQPTSVKGHVPREGQAEGPSGKRGNDALCEASFQSWQISPEQDVGYLQLQAVFIIGLGMGQEAKNPGRQLHQRPAVLPQATIQSLRGSDPVAPDR